MTCDSEHSFRHPENCTFSCNSGYVLTPTSDLVRSCQSNAAWSGSDAVCIGVQCPTLSGPTNGSMSCNSGSLFRHPETCTFSCDEDYLMSRGSRSRTCSAGGTWTGSIAECTDLCEASSDLFFVLDGSGSVGSDNFDAVKEFVVNVVSAFDFSIGTRVGVVQYSSLNRLEFNLSSYDSQTSTLNAINAITFLNGGTYTGAAMEFTRQHADWRPLPIPRIMIVVTDGQSGDSVVGPAWALAADRVTVFAIGVAGYDHSQLIQITNNVPGRVFELAEFIDLSQDINQIVQALCNP
ncbi:vitrin-like [Branchiostoma lanceolatum]|uniref:vitrin-like n=1 Tax=Branchiostoma lanceolatum TaxID=7740 RepID=UPI003456B483